MEDIFSTDGVGDGSGGNTSDGEGQMKLPSLSDHLLLCGPDPNRLRTAISARPRGWGPLMCTVLSSSEKHSAFSLFSNVTELLSNAHYQFPLSNRLWKFVYL